MVLRRCRKLLANEADAFDAMQDVFVEILKRYRTLNLHAPSSLLYRIATNVCLNKIRANKRRENIMTQCEDHVLSNIAGIDNNESHWLLHKVLTRLINNQTDQTQTMLVMYLVDGMTLEYIGKHFNISLSTVRRRIEHAKSKLNELRG